MLNVIIVLSMMGSPSIDTLSYDMSPISTIDYNIVIEPVKPKVVEKPKPAIKPKKSKSRSRRRFFFFRWR